MNNAYKCLEKVLFSAYVVHKSGLLTMFNGIKTHCLYSFNDQNDLEVFSLVHIMLYEMYHCSG